MGFKRVLSDASIYIYSKGEVKLIVPIFIDDITLVSKNDTTMDSTVQELSKHFKLWDLDATTFLLSVQVSQSHYVDELLKCFNIEDCNSVKTPLSPGSDLFGLVPTFSQQEEMRFIPYLAAVGSLQYLATMTRPDIAYAVSYLGRFNHNPHPKHWTAVKHLLCYLKSTSTDKLVYIKSDDSELF